MLELEVRMDESAVRRAPPNEDNDLVAPYQPPTDKECKDMSRLIVQAVTYFVPVLSLSFSLTADAGEPDLIRRDAVALHLNGANVVIQGALKKAAEMRLNVNITVVDSGGHLLAFTRMDGARPASIYTSMSKAATAALKLSDTGVLGGADEPPNIHLNLAVENAARMSGGKFTTLKGGVAIIVDDQVIGGVGVGGATGSEDTEIARAGLAALHAALKITSDE